MNKYNAFVKDIVSLLVREYKLTLSDATAATQSFPIKRIYNISPELAEHMSLYNWADSIVARWERLRNQ